MFWSFAKTTIICVLAPAVLWQMDRGIWWHACVFRSIRIRRDTDEVKSEYRNPFLLAGKLVPFLVASFGIFLIAAEDSLLGLAIGLVGVVWFCMASMVYAHRALHTAAK